MTKTKTYRPDYRITFTPPPLELVEPLLALADTLGITATHHLPDNEDVIRALFRQYGESIYDMLT